MRTAGKWIAKKNDFNREDSVGWGTIYTKIKEGNYHIATIETEPGFDSDGNEADPQTNAAYIVKACNMHDELVEVLKEALDTLNPQDGEITAMTIKQGWPWSQKVRALLAKTKVSE